MQTVVDVNFEKSDMMLDVARGKTVVSQTVSSDKITRIVFGQETVRSWLSKKTVPKIVIYLKGTEGPFVIQSGKTNLPFAKLEAIVRQFAEKNHVQLE